jgi:hypothetical protein
MSLGVFGATFCIAVDSGSTSLGSDVTKHAMCLLRLGKPMFKLSAIAVTFIDFCLLKSRGTVTALPEKAGRSDTKFRQLSPDL